MPYFASERLLRRIVQTLRGLLVRVRRPWGPRDGILVVGHRGAPREAAENTPRSFATAVRLGANAVETDVCLTRDERVVLWHDCDPDGLVALARQRGVEPYLYMPLVPARGSALRRPVHQIRADELCETHGYVRRRRRFFRRLFRPAGAPTVTPATLEDLFAWAAHEPRLRALFLDVKLPASETAAAAPLVAAVRRVRARLGVRQIPVRFLCADRDVAAAVGAALPVGLGGSEGFCLVSDFEHAAALEVARELGLRDVSIGMTPNRLWAVFERELADVIEARRRGQLDSVAVWTLNDEARLRIALGYGIDAVITDDPALARRVLDAVLRGAGPALLPRGQGGPEAVPA